MTLVVPVADSVFEYIVSMNRPGKWSLIYLPPSALQGEVSLNGSWRVRIFGFRFGGNDAPSV